MGRHLKNDYIGKICGCWQVLERDNHPSSKSHETFWICKCLNCGSIASVRKTNLDRNPKGCNICKRKWGIGDQFGLLTIIGKAPKPNYVMVQCACGSEPFAVRLSHLKGQGDHSRTISCGCLRESGGELKIKQILEQYNYNFQKQYRIKEKKDNYVMIFDFVIFDENNQIIKCIEYDGEQHFRPIEFFGGEEQYQIQRMRDERKNKWCENNGIVLLRVPYYDFNKIDKNYLFPDN